MEAVIGLLTEILIALQTMLTIFNPVTASVAQLSLSVEQISEQVMPMAVIARNRYTSITAQSLYDSFVVYSRRTDNTSSYNGFQRYFGYVSTSTPTDTLFWNVIGYDGSYATGTTLVITYTNLYGIAQASSSTGSASWINTLTTNTAVPFYIVDDSMHIYGTVTPGSGSIEVTLDRTAGFIGIGICTPPVVNSYPWTQLRLDSLDITAKTDDSLSAISSNVQSILTTLNTISSNITNALIPSCTRIETSLSQILSAIQNISFDLPASPDQDAAASQFLADMGDELDRIDDMTEQIEQGTNRPPVQDILPDVNDNLIAPTDTVAVEGRAMITDVLSHTLILTILSMVFALAFLRYVLFGKVR